MCHIFFIHLSVDGHLGCFHVLAIVNRAVMMNIVVDVSLWITVFSLVMILLLELHLPFLALLLKIELFFFFRSLGYWDARFFLTYSMFPCHIGWNGSLCCHPKPHSRIFLNSLHSISHVIPYFVNCFCLLSPSIGSELSIPTHQRRKPLGIIIFMVILNLGSKPCSRSFLLLTHHLHPERSGVDLRKWFSHLSWHQQGLLNQIAGPQPQTLDLVWGEAAEEKALSVNLIG